MTNSAVQTIDTDVLVIGGGGAGLRAAYEAAASGARTVLAMKGRVSKSGATAFGVAELAGFAVADGAGDPQDNPDVHFQDIMLAGQGCNDPRLVRLLVDEAVLARDDIERWGVEFILDPGTGKPLIAMGDFASRPRNRKIYHHGKPITVALGKQIEQAGVQLLENTTALGLAQDEHGIHGALFLNERGEEVLVRAGATILATGGAGQLFKLSLMPPDITGDGYALGYRAGAPLVNMEFIQAGFGTIKPSLNIIMAWFWALHPKFTDVQGNDLLQDVLPAGMNAPEVMDAKVKHYPFSASDPSRWLEIAAKKAQDQGRLTDLGGFRLDLRDVDEQRLRPGGDLAVMWDVSKKWMTQKRLDYQGGPLEIGLFGHAINGGLVINEHCETTITGLYAVGETAGGPYGADRLGGNMLLNCQVFGRRAGLRAAVVGKQRADQAKRLARAQAPDALYSGKGTKAPREALARVKDIMTQDVLIIRNAQGLLRAKASLHDLRAELMSGTFSATTLKEKITLSETLNLLDTGCMIVEAAMLRKETRGSHYREDFPTLDPALGQPVFIHHVNGQCQVKLDDFNRVMP